MTRPAPTRLGMSSCSRFAAKRRRRVQFVRCPTYVGWISGTRCGHCTTRASACSCPAPTQRAAPPPQRIPRAERWLRREASCDSFSTIDRHHDMKAELESIVRALTDAELLVERRGELPSTFVGITDDSRAVSPGSLFVAVRGSE